ncbi:MAG: hypothetical protein WA783_10080 [Phormidesmis sp.]
MSDRNKELWQLFRTKLPGQDTYVVLRVPLNHIHPQAIYDWRNMNDPQGYFFSLSNAATLSYTYTYVSKAIATSSFDT